MVAQAGYDAVTRTFYIPAGTMYGFSVPERPTVDEVDRARSLIEDALGEFPLSMKRAEPMHLPFYYARNTAGNSGKHPDGACRCPTSRER